MSEPATTFRTEPTTCNRCGTVLEYLSHGNGKGAERGPLPGELTVCMTCGQVSVFLAGGGIRPLNENDEDLLKDLSMPSLMGLIITVQETRSAWLKKQAAQN